MIQAKALADRLREQEPEALQLLLERAFAIARSLSRNSQLPNEEIDDLVQNTLISLLRRISEPSSSEIFTSDHAILSYLKRHLQNSFVDHYRSKYRRSSPMLAEDVALSESDQPEERASEHDRIKLLEKALEQLTPQDRDLISLRFVHEKSYEEIAQELGLSPVSIRVRTVRILKHLNRLMDSAD